ncbi:MAG: HAMP domain-containing protein [Bdellovibrionia bacterium]
MESKRNRRSLFRVLISPKYQLKYGMYYATIALLSLLSWNALTIFFLIQLIDSSVQSDPGMTIAQNLLNTVLDNRWVFLLGMTALASMFMGLAIVLSKNVVGPMRALARHIESLKNGNYDHKTTLRKNDELKPLMNGLNELSDKLKERHGMSADAKRNAG